MIHMDYENFIINQKIQKLMLDYTDKYEYEVKLFDVYYDSNHFV